MKIERLIADITSVGSPARTERDILRVILDVFLQIQATFVAGESLCDIFTLGYLMKIEWLIAM